jgi:hypothetical protein
MPPDLAISVLGTSEDRETCSDPGEEIILTVANQASENGYPQHAGPLTWLNSARLHVDPSEDSVTLVVSVDDPRGGLAFTIRRTGEGVIVIHHPYEKDPLPHVSLQRISDSTLQIVSDPPVSSPRSFVHTCTVPDCDECSGEETSPEE